MSLAKYTVPFLVTVIVVLVGALAYFAGRFGPGEVRLTAASSTPATPVTSPITYKKITGGGVMSFPEYELTVPDSWQGTTETLGPDAQKVIVKNGPYEISITQGGFGGSICLYPGDADIDGPSGRYQQFKNITTQSGDHLRRSWTGNELVSNGFAICHQTQYGWNAPTLYGHIAFITKGGSSTQSLAEMDAILASLTKK